METINKSENSLIFKTEANDTLVNAIRRYVGNVFVLAIDEIEISKNDSPLYDETIAHRLGLVPLKMDKKMKKDIEVEFKLVSKKPGIIYSEELKGDVKIPYGRIPITELRGSQEINITATARLGQGKQHAKYNPGMIFYRNICELKMDKSFLEEVKQICPNANIVEKGDQITIIDDRKEEVLDVCEGLLQKAQKEIETKVTDELIVTVETFGQMDSKDVFLKSLDALKADIEDTLKNFK